MVRTPLFPETGQAPQRSSSQRRHASRHGIQASCAAGCQLRRSNYEQRASNIVSRGRLRRRNAITQPADASRLARHGWDFVRVVAGCGFHCWPWPSRPCKHSPCTPRPMLMCRLYSPQGRARAARSLRQDLAADISLGGPSWAQPNQPCGTSHSSHNMNLLNLPTT